MGAVYRARHLETGVVHALKLVRVGGDDPELASRALARFRREVEVLARIEDHPALVRVHACGAGDGFVWVAMDLVAGRSVAERLRGGPLEPPDAARLVSATADAVEHAHRRGVVHRDLKPENVLLDEHDRPRVVDFGLAFDVFADRLTRTGELLGTPSFMAPEQVARRSGAAAVGPTADVYGLGALLFACLTGRPPHGDGAPIAVVRAILEDDPPPPSTLAAGIPRDLDAVALRALARDPARRYPSAAALGDDLDRWLRGEIPSAVRSAPSRVGRLIVSRRGAISIAGIIGVVVLVLLTGLLSLGGANAVERARRLEAALREVGDLDSRQRDELAALLGDGAALDPESADRLATLDALVRARDGDPAAADELARLVRPAGSVDGPRLRLAERVLHDAERWDALVHVFLATAPAQRLSPRLAAEVARRIADGEGDVPDGPGAFGALVRGAGSDLVAARLRVRRGEVLAGRGPAAWPEALALFERAHRDLDVISARGGWPAPFVAWAGARLRERFGEIDPRAAPLEELLVRVAAGEDLLAPEDAARVQESLYASIASALMGPEAGRARFVRWLTAGLQYLQRHGYHAVGHIQSFIGGVYGPPHGPFERAEVELARAPDRRDPALLLVLHLIVQFLRRDSNGARPPRAWLLAAEEAGIDARWLHFWLAKRFGRERAPAHWARAWELDAVRPPEERWSAIGVGLARAVHTQLAADDSPERVSRLIAVALATADLVEDEVDRVGAFVPAGGRFGRSVHASRTDAAGGLQLAADALIRVGPPRCCAEGDRSVGRLLDRASELAPDADRSIAWGRVRASARHDRAHERREDALAALDEAIDRLRGSGRDATWLGALLAERAELLVELGRPADARRDRHEARALEPAGGQ